jgi:hypothetical protein
LGDTVAHIANAQDWDTRVARIRQVPAKHGTNEHSAIYAAVAKQLYVPHLAPDFAYIPWRPDYELEEFNHAYETTNAATEGFSLTTARDLEHVMHEHPITLRVFRVPLGFTTQEFAGATTVVAEEHSLPAMSNGKVKGAESGAALSREQARTAALTIDLIMRGELFDDPVGDLRRKLDKPDTAQGWTTVRTYARDGVPLAVLLHQRHYGGAFRQLLDATSTQRGNVIEDAVEGMFSERRIPNVRTGANNQAEVETRFEVQVRPAPDFVVFEGDTLRGMLECKGANDGGTARDKALRFERLREESIRLGGVPLFGVLSGLGWTRVNDTLGPVVRDCDGRVFTLANLDEMLTVQPFPQIAGTA